ncbi:phosphopantetheine-binding protein [uncultured Planktosalinus sp.]|uniref:acyl carrier protein n=1 Tax=uncultured Planktosalinus sp. TaxID=1810935 RepID=UPI0030DC5B4D
MTQDKIYQTLETIISTYLPEDVSNKTITLQSNLTSELNINSSHLVDIVLDIEDAFDIAFSNDDMQSIQTVGDVIQLIESKTT